MKSVILVICFLSVHGMSATLYARNNSPVEVKPVFVHAVYFWLHDHVTEGQKAEFVLLLRSFKRIKSVKSIYIGPPAGTPRTVVDNSYDVALIVGFRNKAGHDYYQAHRIHTDAIKIFEGWIRDIKIYDMVQE
jgi:hypothetical protein